MGIGVYVQNAAKNLMSAVQLRKAYTRVPSDGDCICYVHKEDNSKITFRLQKDGYYHTKLWSGERASVHAVDFYNPAPLTPVAPEDAVNTWRHIHTVEQMHWTTNHANAIQMKKLCIDPTYVGMVTPTAIDLFYKHRGCAA